MDCVQTTESWASTTPTLTGLIKHLQFYSKPPNFNFKEFMCKQNDGVCVESGTTTTTNSRDRRRAAVLICIFEGNEGEVALPGGKRDEEDVDDTATALREAMEEIGLHSSLLQVVYTLEPFISAHLLTVVPVVGILHRPQEFKPLLNPYEVDAIFDVPLNTFLKGENYRVVEREWGAWRYICHIFDIETEQGDFVVGGLTASILIRAASIIYERPPSFGLNDHPFPDFQQLHHTLKTLP
ncbi:hypothetical protein LguiA_032056 [Lonicera macranthoides]